MIRYELSIEGSTITASIMSPSSDEPGVLEVEGDSSGVDAFKKWLSSQYDQVGHLIKGDMIFPSQLHYAISTWGKFMSPVEVENDLEINYSPDIPDDAVS